MRRLFLIHTVDDEPFKDQVDTQLEPLKRRGLVETWFERRITLGQKFAGVVELRVETADVFVVLVSAKFLASDYPYQAEMRRIMERHEAGSAVVIPVILKFCAWHESPLGKLNAVPRDGKPITKFADRDEALLQVGRAVRLAAEGFCEL